MSKHKQHNEKKGLNPFKQNNAEVQENINEQQTEPEAQAQEEVVEKDNAQAQELETLKNQYLRLAADFDNYRKRQVQEREQLLKYGAEDTIKKLIPVLDTYERAKKSCENMEDTAQLKESFEMVFKQLFDILEKAGVKKIEALGQQFDPNIHDAVMQTPTNEHPDQSIIDELQTGYTLGDRVLRPTLVNVATGE
ncbi:MAG: nucleotide exchange factor GrpE [Candidatus Gastranaerophilales bacterium]|nr:nucleotide exchange factor GrpE [Candidatus Gastranaerophilales bacterium]